jgi:activator of HSP90 ATPase
LSAQVPDAKIVQSWRFVDWHDGVASTVTFEFSSTQYGVTSLKVRQTGVPEEDKFGHRGIVPKVADGWNSKFFTPISKVLGFAFYTEDDDD